MTAPLYRIKLYGHSGQDTEWFAKKLAVILEMSDEDAVTLVKKAPAVIKEGIDKDRVERLREILASINALILVEPMGEIDVTPESQLEKLDALASVEVEKQDTLRADTWMTVGIACAGILVVLTVVGYIASWDDFGRQSSVAVAQASKDRPRPPALDPKKKDRKMRSLRAGIRAAEKEAATLDEQVKLMAGDSPPPSDIRAWKDRDKRLIAAGRKLDHAKFRVLQLRKELHDLESR